MNCRRLHCEAKDSRNSSSSGASIPSARIMVSFESNRSIVLAKLRTTSANDAKPGLPLCGVPRKITARVLDKMF